MSTEYTSNDLQDAIGGAEDMLRQAKTSTTEKAAELRERAIEQLRTVREKLQIAQEAVVDKSKAAARATDDYVHENPWTAIGAGVAAGVLIGLLLNRR
jgi:ElaB/YqjD/DUF883 family membrane-anchored ribosome-binding protein